MKKNTVENAGTTAQNHGDVEIRRLAFGLAVDSQQVEVLPDHLLDKLNVELVLATQHHGVLLMGDSIHFLLMND
jgi:hypothetical protein